jgi:galactose mutarotase-like enzyme
LDSTVSTEADAPWLRVVDRVTNISGEPADLELLYHINLGSPLLVPGSKLHAPIRELAPRDAHSATDVATWANYAAAQAGSQEFAHFAQLACDERGHSRVLLELPSGEQGVSLSFDHRALPCFTLWKSQRLPGDGYLTGLEPGINFPNVKSFEQQQRRVARLEPGETRQFEFELQAHDAADSVRQAAAKVASLAARAVPQIRDEPKREWSPT